MRVLGEINHATYKITILKMNEKVTVQIEDRLVSQSYAFRDGSGVSDLSTAKQLLTSSFMNKVDALFIKLNENYHEALEQLNIEEFDDFEII